MTDIEEITEGLMEAFRALRAGSIENKDADALANVAGKYVSAQKVRLAYHMLKGGETPTIDGLETTPKTQRLTAIGS